MVVAAHPVEGRIGTPQQRESRQRHLAIDVVAQTVGGDAERKLIEAAEDRSIGQKLNVEACEVQEHAQRDRRGNQQKHQLRARPKDRQHHWQQQVEVKLDRYRPAAFGSVGRMAPLPTSTR